MAKAETFTMQTRGFRSLEDALRSFANDFNYKTTEKNVLIPAMRKAITHTKTTIAAFAPRSDDERALSKRKDPRARKHMADTVRSSARVPNSKDKRSAYLTENDVALAEAGIFTDQRSLSQEFGNVKTSKQEFLRRALRYSGIAVLDTFENEIYQKIQSYRDQNQLTKD